jgi:hypothetical protein
MKINEYPAEYIEPGNNMNYPVNPDDYSPYATQQMMQGPSQDNELFSRPNDLRVIQEYNQEENLPVNLKKDFWGLISKSIKLGFWKETDMQEIFLHKNVIKVGHIMSKGRHKYTFAERQQMNQIDFLVYADFKRGIGMERYKINERTLQATSVQQHIQGGGATGSRKGGLFSGLKSFFG